MTKLRPLIAGNWKMNGLKPSLGELAAIGQGAGEIWRKMDLLICPPATL
ncbi:MAG: triose-phosphate isomerase, partial [Nitrobacter sp.]